MPKKDGTMTKAEKRDVRDAVNLAFSIISTSISLASLALPLSPRRDEDGVELAKDLQDYLESRGVGRFGLMDLHRVVSDPESIRYAVEAVGCLADEPRGRAILGRLGTRQRFLERSI